MKIKRILIVITLVVASAVSASAQKAIFWTNDDSCLPIRIYVDKTMVGEITQAYDSAPQFGAPGAVSVNLTYERHDLAAANCYGQVYEGWPDELRPRIDKLNSICLRAGQYQTVSHSNPMYSFMFIGWNPGPGVRVPGLGRVVPNSPFPRGGSPREDDDLAIAMAVGAFAGATAMTVKAVNNWNYPDYRFPGVLVGYNFQYLPSLNAIRNVARVKTRFGNLGGVSFLADFGSMTQFYPVEYYDDYMYNDWGGYRSRTTYENSFTCSFGFGLEYSGFGMNFMYMPNIEEYGATALTCNLGYDFYIQKKFVISLAAGFGISGEGSLGDYFEWPLSVGFSYRF